MADEPTDEWLMKQAEMQIQSYYNPSDIEWEYARRDALVPDWSQADKVHDWRNHVSKPMQGLWNLMPLWVRLLVYFRAEDDASSEEWD